jgi:hypothetical protein
LLAFRRAAAEFVALRAAGVALPPTARQLPANVPDVVRRRFSSADSCLRSGAYRLQLSKISQSWPARGQPLPSGASSGRSGSRVAGRESLSLDRDVAVRKIVGAGLSEKFPDHLFLVLVVAFAEMVVA